MGIPSLFRVFVQEDPTLYSKTIPCKQCDVLYIDYNCLIHYASKISDSHDDEDVIAHVVSYTRQLINDVVKPINMVYIAMDGPVPISKMVRQRERRFKKMKDDRFLKNNSSTSYSFDSNRITPGTEFMFKLSTRLKSVIKLGIFKVKQIIFSDSSIRGEGEYKIFNHLRTNVNLRNVVVYGLDADLMVWSMAINRIDIVLCRENDEGHLYFFHLQRCMHNMFVKYNIHWKYCQCPYGLLLDIVLILMLGGNDFVCPIEYLKIRENGWNSLLSTYSICQYYITNPYTLGISWDYFRLFIHELSQYEDSLTKQKHVRAQRASSRISREDSVSQCYYHESFSSNRHPLHSEYRCIVNSIPYFESHPCWKKHYYERIFGTPHTIPGFMETLCRDYISSIVWCWEYYTKPVVPSWSFAYEHIAGPCLSDVVLWFDRVLQESIRNAFVDTLHGNSPSPLEQLIYVTPPTGISILPIVIQLSLECDENPIHEYHVTDFTLEPITGQKMIYSNPILPKVDLNVIKQVLWCIYPYLSTDDKRLDRLESFPFVHNKTI